MVVSRYGHVKRRDEDYVSGKVLEMQVPGKIKRGRRYLDVVM